MNYMKILLIYMAAAFSLSVQSTSAPVETPVPTPTAIVDETTGETTFPPDDGILTPAPAETATPNPVPEITPNKKYKQLERGDKGANVKAMQERLIELGYLPEGAADGNFGNQTYKAVRNFQKNNGLTVDGIAGKRTLTYLYENPDVNPAVTPTPAPTDTPEPTEAPTETPEEIPTEEPTPAPTDTPEPTEAPTEAPEETEAPTEEPEMTEAPEEPTEVPTEDPTPAQTAGAPVTSAPSTKPPVAEPTMSVEEIDPADLQFQDAPGSIAYNDEEEPLSWLALEDGVQILHKPRLQKREGQIRVSLDDLAACLETWNLTDDGNSVTLTTNGHTLALLNEDAGISAMIDGILTPVKDEEFDFTEGHFISADFLASALGGEARWAEDENTLILRIPEPEEE